MSDRSVWIQPTGYKKEPTTEAGMTSTSLIRDDSADR